MMGQFTPAKETKNFSKKTMVQQIIFHKAALLRAHPNGYIMPSFSPTLCFFLVPSA
jgi:hypothetical protein